MQNSDLFFQNSDLILQKNFAIISSKINHRFLKGEAKTPPHF